MIRPRSERSRAGPRPGRAALAAVLAVLVIISAGALVTLLHIKSELDAGRNGLTGLTLASVDHAGGPLAAVSGAADHLRAADRSARHSVFLSVLRPVPLLGNQVKAIRELTGASTSLGELARTAARRIDRRLGATGGNPAARIALLDTVLTEMNSVQRGIDGVHVRLTGPVIGPLRNAGHTLTSALDRAQVRLADGKRSVRALRGLLAGPTDYLVLAANNAEMRGGQGMPLSAGLAHIENGDVTLGDFVSTIGLYKPQPTDAGHPPAQLLDTYTRFNIGADFPETAVSPNFPAIAPLHASLAAQGGLGPTQGVFQVDAVALRDLMTVSGPVTVNGTIYDAANIEQQILNENYMRFDTLDVRDQRLNLQSQVARAIFDRLRTADVPVTKLALALSHAAKGRHLMAWSQDHEVQRLFDQLDATGSLPRGGLLISAQNVSANKLDWYLNPRVDLKVLPAADGYLGRLSFTIANLRRSRTSAYIEGHYQDIPPGDHRLLLTVQMPGGADRFRSTGPDFEIVGTDGPLTVVGIRFLVKKGTTRTVSFDFHLPPGAPFALLLPSARVRPTTVVINGRATNDAVAHYVSYAPATSNRGAAGSSRALAGAAAAMAIALVLGMLARRAHRQTLLVAARLIVAISAVLAVLGMVLALYS